ncbi:MAG: chain length determinant protein tyrosine kinase EpsG [Pseudomonadota bacterium]
MKQTATPISLPTDRSLSRMGRLLVENGKLTAAQAEQASQLQQDRNIRFGEAAQALGFISEADIQRVLAQQFDYPYLAPGEGPFPPQLVAAYQPFSPPVEILRVIRTQLMLQWFAAGHKALALVNISPEDSSLFAANLAVVFSQLGEQTVLVDGNLRNPCQHELFGIEQRTGLSDILAGRASIEALCRVDAFLNLSVLPAGTLPPNPQELLGRPAFRSIHNRLASSFDVILYDVSASSTGASALAIAAQAEGVLMIARKNQSRFGDLKQMNAQLDRSGAQVIGSVLVDF